MSEPLQPSTTALKENVAWDGKMLPATAVDQGAVHLANDPTQCNEDRLMEFLHSCAIPAWRYSFWCLVILWTCWLIFPAVSYQVAVCNENGDLAEVPSWVLLIYLPPLCAALLLEQLGWRFLLPAEVKIAGGYKICGCHLPFRMYQLLVSGFSVLSHADLATSGIFLAKVLKTWTCNSATFTKLAPTFVYFVIFAWFAMSSQLALAIFHGMPVASVNKEGRPLNGFSALLHAKKVVRFSQMHGHLVEMKVMSTEDDVGVYTAVISLAEAARMNVWLFRHFSLQTIANKNTLQYSAKRMDWINAMERAIARVVAFLLLESSLMLNLQVWGLRIAQEITPNQKDAMIYASTFTSLLVGVKTLVFGVKSVHQMWLAVWPFCQPDCEDGYLADSDHGPMARRSRVIRDMWILAITASATLASMMYAGSVLLSNLAQ